MLWVFCLYVYMCTMCVLEPIAARKKAQNPLELELWRNRGHRECWELNVGPRRATVQSRTAPDG